MPYQITPPEVSEVVSVTHSPTSVQAGSPMMPTHRRSRSGLDIKFSGSQVQPDIMPDFDLVSSPQVFILNFIVV